MASEPVIDNPAEPISLDTPQQEPINLDTPGTTSVDTTKVQDFATKYDYALGKYSPSKETLNFAMINGQEPMAREHAVAEDRIRQRAMRGELVKEYMASRPVAAVTKQDVDTIYELTDPQAAALNRNPKTFFEEEYAKRVVNEGLDKEAFAHVINSVPPEYSTEAIAQGESTLAIREIAKKVKAELDAERANQGWAPFLADLGESMIPLTSWYKQTGALPGGPAGSWWLGENLELQAMALYRMKPAEAEEALRRAVNTIKNTSPVFSVVKAGNILDASNYVDYMMDPSTINRYLNNAFSVMDASIVLPKVGFISAGAYAGIGRVLKSEAKQMADAVKDIVIKGAASSEKHSSPKLAEAAGDIPNAALELALIKVEQKAAQAGSPTNIDSLAGELKTLVNPRAVVTQSENALSSENALRLTDILEKQSISLLNKGFGDPLNIDRLKAGSKAIGVGADETLALWERQYPDLSDAVLNVRPWSATPLDRSVAENTKAMEKVVVDALDELKKRGLHARYFDYLIHSANVEKINQDLAALLGKPLAPDPMDKSWKQASKAIERLEAGDALKARAAESFDKIMAMSPTERKLFFMISNAERNIARQPPVPEIPPKWIEVYKDPLANVDYLGVKLGRMEVISTQIGHPHAATFFKSAEEAEHWAKDTFQLKEYRLGQHGTGHYIEVFKAIDETMPSVRRALAQETKAGVSGITKRTLGWLTSPDYQLPADLSLDRKVAIYGTSALAEAEKAVADQINKIPRALSPSKLLGRAGSRKDFQTFLNYQREFKEAGSDTPGKFSSTQGDLEKEFTEVIGRIPTFDETVAYWSYVQLYETEFGLRNLAIHRDKSRLGWEMHDFGFGKVEGKFHAAMPEIKEDFGVLVADTFEHLRNWGGGKRDVVGPKGGTTSKTVTKEMQKEYFDKLTGEGYRLVQLTSFAQKDMQAAAKEMGLKIPEDIHFVFTKSLDSTPLQYQQIPYRPGGHHTYDAQFYIRQPVLRSSQGVTTYYEDRNMAGFNNIKKAELFADRFNTAREMYLKGTPDAELSAYLRKNLPYGLDSFKKQFDPSKGGQYDINTKFYVTHADQTVDSAHNLANVLGLTGTERFRRAADSELNMYKNTINLKYAGERGDVLKTIEESGTMHNPTFKFNDNPMLDPLPALDRSMSAAMRGRYLEDLKFRSAEEYVAAFGDLIEATPAQLKENPMRWLYSGKFKENALDQDRLGRAVNYRRAALEMFGMKSAIQKDVDSLITKVGGALWNKTGDKGFTAAEPWLQYTKGNPVEKLKAAVFDFKMAWNPVQIFLQAQQLGAVAGIEGAARAGKTFPAASWSQFLRYYRHGDDMETLDFVAKAVAAFHTPGVEKVTSKAPKIAKDVLGDMGTGAWKAEHFKEAYLGMKASGFDNVGREYADAGDFIKPNIVEGKLAAIKENYSAFMNIGRATFRTGERFSRDSAWFAAYDKWRVANPTANFDDDAIKLVVERADLLNNRMSSASAASYQRSPITTLGTQFMGYQLRMFEMITSGLVGRGQLTQAEAARLLLTQSVIYGVPISVGTMTLGFPFYEYIQKEMMNRGIDTEANPYLRFMMEGGVNEVMRNLIDNRPGFSGNTNFAERYGPGNMSFLQDVFGKDGKSAFDIMMGVSGSTLKNMLLSTEPFMMSLGSFFSGADDSYKLKAKDFDAVMANVSGYNAGTRLLAALNTGKYFAKNGLPIDEVTKTEAWMKAVLGVDPQRVSDIHKMNEINRDLAELQRKQLPFVRKEFQDMMAAYKDDNDAEAHKSAIRMKAHIIAGGWREDQKHRLFQEVTRGAESQLHEVSRKFQMATPQRLEAFMKRLER